MANLLMPLVVSLGHAYYPGGSLGQRCSRLNSAAQFAQVRTFFPFFLLDFRGSARLLLVALAITRPRTRGVGGEGVEPVGAVVVTAFQVRGGRLALLTWITWTVEGAKTMLTWVAIIGTRKPERSHTPCAASRRRGRGESA